jgi:hypothetical protein
MFTRVSPFAASHSHVKRPISGRTCSFDGVGPLFRMARWKLNMSLLVSYVVHVAAFDLSWTNPRTRTYARDGHNLPIQFRLFNIRIHKTYTSNSKTIMLIKRVLERGNSVRIAFHVDYCYMYCFLSST